MITRRGFLYLLAVAPIVAATSKTKPIHIETIWKPHPAQLKFFNESELPMHLYGVPYHQSNGSSGEWLGISRTSEQTIELQKLINVLENDKLQSLCYQIRTS